MNKKDYYQILGVDKNASQKEVRQAYRKLAFQYHPDKNRDNPAATEKMKEINEAYAILSNPVKRREYNALRERYGDLAYEHFRQTHSSEDIFRGSDINQIFDDLARMYGFRSADEIFSQFYGPGYRTFEFRRSGLFGKGFVFYQAPGQQHRAGDPTIYGSQAPVPQIPFSGVLGALIKHFLQRVLGIQFPEKGRDWKDVITLSSEQVEKGNEVEYIHKKYGEPRKLMVKIPLGIKNGQRIRLKGMGAPGRGGGESGDMYLEVRIKVPLSKKIKGIFK
jgi:DnaJ-class molecular chaperone